MHPEEDYIQINKNSWNNKTKIHLHSEFYNVEGFKQGKTSLNPIELDLLGNIAGKKILHLQCHFGQDTISLARMGAHVTGIDLSDKAIDTAKELAVSMGQDVQFICCNIYDLKAGYNYFNSGPIVETETGTYADRYANICQTYVGWNHSMGEVLQSLIDQQLQIQNYQEYDYSPYNIFSQSEEFEPNKFRVKHMNNKIPLVYSVVAVKGTVT